MTVSDGTAPTPTSFQLTVNAASASGLVAAYSFEGGTGPTVADVSGNNNAGTISGATWSPTGKFGGALAFAGTTARVLVPGAPTLNLTAMTLEAWVQPSATLTGWHAVLQREVDAYFLHASSEVGTMRPAGGGTFTGGVTWIGAPSTIPVNAWTHLATTYDGATVRLYVNGTQVASQAQTGALETNTSPLWIGNNTYGEYFRGLIDEVRVYNRALTATEIQTDMATALGGPPPVNTAPTISAIGTQTITEDTATAAIGFTVGDAETAAGSLR